MTEDNETPEVIHDLDALAHHSERDGFRTLPDKVGTLVRFTLPERLREHHPESFTHAQYALRSEMFGTGEPIWMVVGVGQAYSLDSAKVLFLDRWEVVETPENYGYGVDTPSETV